MMPSTPHYRSKAAWLVLLLLSTAQVAVLTVPLALAIGRRPDLAWRDLAQQMAGGTAPWAAIAAIAGAILLGGPAGMALWRARAGAAWAGLLLTPALVPITLMAQSPGTLGDLPPLGLLLACHAGMGLGFGAGFTWLALLPLDSGMLRAAASCGWSPAGVFGRLMLPLALRGMAAGGFLATLMSLSISLGHLLPALAAPLPDMLTLPKLLILSVTGSVLLASLAVGTAMMLLKRT